MATPYRSKYPLASIPRDGDWNPPAALVGSMGDPDIGQLVPVILVETVLEKGKPPLVSLIDGRRRIAAAKSLGWTTIKALVFRDKSAAAQAMALLAANVHSPNLLSEARAIAELVDELGEEEAMAQILASGGLDKAQVKKRRKMLRLISPLQERLESGDLSKQGAFLLSKLDEEDQARAYAEAVEEAKAKHPNKPEARPTVAMIKAAVRRIRGEKIQQLPVPVPTREEAKLIEPTNLALEIKTLAARMHESGNIRKEDLEILMKAVAVLGEIGNDVS